MVGSRSPAPLVERAQRGDAEAFTELLRANDDRMRGLSYQLLRSQAAMDDALQEAYIKAFTKMSDFRSDAAFSTWLYRIVYTTCIDHIRRRDRRREVGLQSVPEQAEPRSFEDETTERDHVQNALSQLSPDHRATLLLIDRDGLSYDDASLVLDINPGTVASRLNRARAAFKIALNDTTTNPEGTNR